jgi:DnaJ family protein C protein 13
VRFLYERLVERAFRGAELHLLPPQERAAALEVLSALSALLQQEPRLLGLLTSRSALSPLAAALAPAARAGVGAGAGMGAAKAPGAPPGANGEVPAAVEALPAARVAADAAGGADAGGGAPEGDAALVADAEALAAGALALLSGATQNAQLVAALADEAFVRTLLWLAQSPPSGRVLGAALGMLRALSALPVVALVCGYQGGALLLLDVLLHAPGTPWPWEAATARGGSADSGGGGAEEEAVRGAAAAVLGRVMADATHGPRVTLVLEQLLPPGLVAAIGEGPPEAVLRALAQVRRSAGLRVGALEPPLARRALSRCAISGPRSLCCSGVLAAGLPLLPPPWGALPHPCHTPPVAGR